MRHALILTACCFVLFGWISPSVEASVHPPARISKVEAYRIHYREHTSFHVTRTTHAELEQVLGSIHQMAGMRSYSLPKKYILFRFPSPVTLTGTPVVHPIREVIVTPPRSSGIPPRLLVKNPQQQWVEYKTSRPLAPLLDQIQAGEKPSIETVSLPPNR
ncbi:hypothetical protein [Paludifilum halophilum]|uniref:Bypass of forespore C C-terminal domain-containing protein n=1 Tax=Paludifilum halophilum TaxID=1642702 RepID=A0A235B993_9BACL|nr:hypothetical protein [Paludifilum halophilum]OYD08880.1 hypothetical protein CHM34_03605 [Paludifilum halophilum]